MENIREKLTQECPFPSAWNKLDHTELFTQEFAHIDCHSDFSGWREAWCFTHKKLHTMKRWMELLNISKAMRNLFPSLPALTEFCRKNAAYNASGVYNFFLEGQEADYWIHINSYATPNNHSPNMVIRSIVKEVP